MINRTNSVARLAPASEPNIIPFIDVLLVLLVIFLVTSPKPTVDLHLDLPQPGVLRPSVDRPTLVELRSGGDDAFTLTVDREPVAFDQLAQAAFARAHANNPSLDVEQVYAEARIFVRAEQSLAYGDVVMVMDALNHARFAKVGVFAETAEAS